MTISPGHGNPLIRLHTADIPQIRGVGGSDRDGIHTGWGALWADGSSPSVTVVNYTRPGLDEYPGVLVVGEGDPHLLIDRGLVGWADGREAMFHRALGGL